MAVSNGQLANQTTFNTAFMSRTIDTSTTGKVDLNNSASPAVTDSQTYQNGLASVLGVLTSIAYNAVMSWASDIVGASGDTFKARIQALVAKFHNSTGHTHDGTQGNGGIVPFNKLSGVVVSEQGVLNGTSSVAIVFPDSVDLGVTDYKVFWSMRNAIDGQTIAATGKTTSRAGTGFTLELDAAIDSDNYVIDYAAMKKTG